MTTLHDKIAALPEWPERFSSKVERVGDCLLWTGVVSSGGYGSFRHNGKMRRTHRLAFEWAFGPIPAGLCVCHACDNRRCVNPEHLWLGTYADNNADMVRKGRDRQVPAIGEVNGRSKLTEAAVKAIHADLRPSVEVAADFGVSPSNVSLIRLGKAWPEVTGGPATMRCRRGHAITSAKTDKRGRNVCVECERARWRKYYYKRRGQRAA